MAGETDESGRRQMKSLRAWHWLAAATVAALLAAPCIALALHEMRNHQLQRAIALSNTGSVKAPPSAVTSVRAVISPYRRLSARGSYDHAHEVLIRGREHQDQPGFHVVTPLRVEGGALLVLRGWIPLRDADPVRLAALREPGEVALEGIPLPLEASVLGEGDAAIAPGDAWPLQVDALRVEDLKARLPYPVFRYVVQQLRREQMWHPSDAAGAAASSAIPRRLAEPRFDDHSHRRNANLWYAAAAVLAALPFARLWQLARRP